MGKINTAWTIDFEIKAEIVKLTEKRYGKGSRKESEIANDILKRGLKDIKLNKPQQLYDCPKCGKIEALEECKLCCSCKEKQLEEDKDRVGQILEEQKQTEIKDTELTKIKNKNLQIQELKKELQSLEGRKLRMFSITDPEEIIKFHKSEEIYKERSLKLDQKIKTVSKQIEELMVG